MLALLSLRLVYHLCFFLDYLRASYLLLAEFPVIIGYRSSFYTLTDKAI